MMQTIQSMPGAAAPESSLTSRLTLRGQLQQPQWLCAADLPTVLAARVTTMQLVARETPHPWAISNVRGVRLRDVLELAGIDRSDRNRLKKLVAIASSSDGYHAIFSWNELFNGEAGGTIMVIFERDGQPLSDDEGPLALIAGQDFWTGPRHVKNLHSIELRQILD